MKNLIIAIYNSIRKPDFQKALAYLATFEFIYYAIGIIAFTTIALVVSLIIMTLAVFPWYYVIFGLLIWIGMAAIFSYIFDAIMQKIIKE